MSGVTACLRPSIGPAVFGVLTPPGFFVLR